MLVERVRIQRLGSERWVLINVPPGEVWPRVRNFLSVNGLNVERADIGLGLIETGWVEFVTDPDSYDRYRLQIDQGVQPDTSEIHIRHLSIPKAQVGEAVPEWPEYSSNAERESWLLEELAATLASEGGEAGTSLLAQGIGGDTKAGLLMAGTEPVLTLKLDRERALATLTHAMGLDGFTILDRDVAAGIYYLHYEKPSTEKPGWFSRRFGKASRPKPEPSSPYTLDALLTSMPEGNILEQGAMSERGAEHKSPGAPGYLLILSGESGDIRAHLRDPYGKRLPPREARELLSVLRNNLI
jgi:outer membrane protein assembly factor BamC